MNRKHAGAVAVVAALSVGFWPSTAVAGTALAPSFEVYPYCVEGGHVGLLIDTVDFTAGYEAHIAWTDGTDDFNEVRDLDEEVWVWDVEEAVSATVYVYADGATGAPLLVTDVLTCEPSFSDVPADSPFFDDVEWMAAEGISTGYEDGTFRPAAAVSRQAMAAFMYRFAYNPVFDPPAEPSFVDVPVDSPFYLEVEWMAAEGISTGYDDGTFRPAAAVSRQAMSAFLFRLVEQGTYEPGAVPSFSDVPAGSPFYGSVEWMADNEVSTGYADGTFRPGASVSRQAMAAFMYRADVLLPAP